MWIPPNLDYTRGSRDSMLNRSFTYMYIVRCYFEFHTVWRAFKVYRACEQTPSTLGDIIILSITTELTAWPAATPIGRLYLPLCRGLFIYYTRRKSKCRCSHRITAGSHYWKRRRSLYLSSPSITARLRFAIWHSTKIQMGRGGGMSS